MSDGTDGSKMQRIENSSSTSREDDVVFANKSMQQLAIEYLFKQGVGTVVLVAACFVLYSTLTTQIPMHIKVITDGYKEISQQDREARAEDAKANREARTEDAKKHLEAVKAIVDDGKEARQQLERIITGRLSKLENQ